jgi:hypothetical protein
MPDERNPIWPSLARKLDGALFSLRKSPFHKEGNLLSLPPNRSASQKRNQFINEFQPFSKKQSS